MSKQPHAFVLTFLGQLLSLLSSIRFMANNTVMEMSTSWGLIGYLE